MTDSGSQTTRGLTRVTSVQSASYPEAPVSTPEPGDVLGRYAVIEELGRGGTGVVLRAYDPRLQREVALKVLRAGVLDASSEAWMVQEARAMAKLSHPNVVAVYDVEQDQAAGMVVAMEYVAGGTLRQWLKTPRPWTAIVAAFVQAGRGLAAAHAKGLLHRDFKPANVLVTDDGRIKVTDFGLAKLGGRGEGHGLGRGSGSSRSLELTQGHVVMGTPRYMAPEQHAGGELDERTDQYAFCVALWGALAGAPPFDGSDLEAYQRAKTRGPPPWPKGTSVPAVVRKALVRGLAVEPAQRWSSMDELLAVLRRSLGRGRRRAVLGASAAIVGLAVASTWWAGRTPDERCTGAREQLEGAWDPARRQAVRDAMAASELPYAAATGSRTEAQLDAYADAWAAQHTDACEATTLRGEQSAVVMDLRMACLQRARLALVAVVDELAQADARTIENAYQVVDGLPRLSRCTALEALEAEVPPPGGDAIASVDAVRARLSQAEAKTHAGHYEPALELLEGLEPEAEATGYAPLRTEVALTLGAALERMGRYDEAERAFQRALRSGLAWRQWELALEATAWLAAVVGFRQGRAGEGLAYMQTAWGLLDRAPGQHEQEALVRSALGVVLQSQGKYPEAEAEHRQVLALRERALGPDHLYVATARSNLGLTLESQGESEAAEVEYAAALRLRQEVLGPDHPVVAISRSNLANALMEQGKHEAAEAEYRAALALLVRVHGPDHPEVAGVRSNLGNVLEVLGKHAEAEAELRAALATRIAALGREHPDVAASRFNLGLALQASGKHEQAEAEYRAALVIFEQVLGREHPNVAAVQAQLDGLLATRRESAHE